MTDDRPYASPDEFPITPCPICGAGIPTPDVEAHLAAVHPRAVKPPGWEDLNPTLPETVSVGGVLCRPERVCLDDLADWRRQRGVQLLRVSWIGAMGWVSIYGPDGQERPS